MVTTALNISDFKYHEAKVQHTVKTTSALGNIRAMSTAPIEIKSLTVGNQLLRQLQAKQADKIRQALEYRAKHGDPVRSLIGLLSKSPVDNKRWQEIIDEPYG